MHTIHCHQAKGSLIDARVQAEVIDADADRARTAMLVCDMNGTRSRQRIAFFVAVGCGAAALHWAVVVGLVSHAGWHPLLANVLGWLVAFCISFAGHHLLTFRGHGIGSGSAAARWFMVSAGGFAINEAAYAALLRWTAQRYDLLLAVVLLAVAAGTYLLGRHWVFARPV
jgi:putative flippase GtrA